MRSENDIKAELEAFKNKLAADRKQYEEGLAAAAKQSQLAQDAAKAVPLKEFEAKMWDDIGKLTDSLLNDGQGYDNPQSVMNVLFAASTRLGKAFRATMEVHGLTPERLIPAVILRSFSFAFDILGFLLKTPLVFALENINVMKKHTEKLHIPEPISELVSCHPNGTLDFSKLDLRQDLKNDEKAGIKSMIELSLISNTNGCRMAPMDPVDPARPNDYKFTKDGHDLTAPELTRMIGDDQRLNRNLYQLCKIEFEPTPAPAVAPAPRL
ncbi:MAG: hypothetical protein ACOYKA_03960 [Legionellaceae bacterium]